MKKLVRIKPFVTRVGDHRKVANKNTVIISIDERLPKKFRRSVVFHERTEDRLQRMGMDYDEAHKLANKAEKEKYFKGSSGEKRWKEEVKVVSNLYRRKRKK